VTIKLGRPRDDAPPRARLKSITFKLDEETAVALERVEQALGGPDLRGRTSAVLRRLILEADRKNSKRQ
jgi:hypothetical protein